MNFNSVRIITSDIERLISFYEEVGQVRAVRLTPDFAEIRTESATLAIGSTKTLSFFGGDIGLVPGANRSLIIELRARDVDQEFARLAPLIESVLVQPPTTMPWGNRSLLFRDPDGSLVNLYTPTGGVVRSTLRTGESVSTVAHRAEVR